MRSWSRSAAAAYDSKYGLRPKLGYDRVSPRHGRDEAGVDLDELADRLRRDLTSRELRELWAQLAEGAGGEDSDLERETAEREKREATPKTTGMDDEQLVALKNLEECHSGEAIKHPIGARVRPTMRTIIGASLVPTSWSGDDYPRESNARSLNGAAVARRGDPAARRSRRAGRADPEGAIREVCTTSDAIEHAVADFRATVRQFVAKEATMAFLIKHGAIAPSLRSAATFKLNDRDHAVPDRRWIDVITALNRDADTELPKVRG